MTDDRVGQVVGGSAVAFGALAILCPRLLARLFGVRTDTGEFVYLTRFSGAGNVGLGINLLTARSDDRKRSLAVATAVDGLCCLFAVSAGLSGSLSPPTAVMMALTTGSVAATAAMPLVGSHQ